MQYTAIFHDCNNVHFQMIFFIMFLMFAQNIDCGYTLEPPQNRLSEAVLTSTHNLCFGSKKRKIVYPCKPQLYNIKVVYKGVFVTRTCFRDGNFPFLFQGQDFGSDCTTSWSLLTFLHLHLSSHYYNKYNYCKHLTILIC